MRKIIVFVFLIIFTDAAALFAAPQAYFSPNGNVKERIIERVKASADSIDVMCFQFTSRPLAKSLVAARERGVRVRVLLDASKTEEKNSMYGFLKSKQINVKRLTSPKKGIMHNKVAVFDSKAVLTGSYNWTTGAEYYNYENAVFLDDEQLVFQYLKEFNDLWEMGK
jgi:phosphatidylserine/phosphatidylglycerophosphate/cardiolipin synthase-like enzyme